MHLKIISSLLKDKKYELLLYGFNFGHDIDPYPFWHSSQLEQSNFSGLSDKKIDVAIEGARQIADSAVRKTKYDEMIKSADETFGVVKTKSCFY